MITGHGGNIHELAIRLGCDPADIIDMSSNVNPMGPPEGLLEFLKKNLQSITLLPEADAGEITRAFARNHGLPVNTVLAGNGTTQFIYFLPKVLETLKAIILGPTYSDYADSCRMYGVPVELLAARAKNNFQPDLDQLEDRLEGTDTVFICNPNNPTGVIIPGGTLEWLVKRHPEVFFVIDESYLPFVPDGDRESMLGKRADNLVVLNSMSKIFRIPGLRIGFVIAPEKIIDRFLKFYPPWSVNSLAQASVEFIMNREKSIGEFVLASREYLKQERIRFLGTFSQISGIDFIPSETSFILGRLSGTKAHEVCERLGNERILIRNCSNFDGLSDRYIRISLKSSKINRMAAQKLQRIIAAPKRGHR